jgi:hypothetical protein
MVESEVCESTSAQDAHSLTAPYSLTMSAGNLSRHPTFGSFADISGSEVTRLCYPGVLSELCE